MSHAHRLKLSIEDEIVDGRLQPGERLDEGQLAERFGVSRTPVREALIQLAATGLIELRPRRSTVVSVPGPEQLYEMFETMAEVEASCGKLAARRLTSQQQKALKAAIELCRSSAGTQDPDIYFPHNEMFYHAIYGASGNGFLAAQAISLSRRLAPFRRIQLRARNRLGQSLDEHEQIVAAIFDGDAQRAQSHLHSHVLVQGDRFTSLITNLKEISAAA